MKILRLVTSFRGEASQSFQLGNVVITKLKTENPSAEILIRNLAKEITPHLNDVHLSSFITPAENQSDDQKKLLHIPTKPLLSSCNRIAS